MSTIVLDRKQVFYNMVTNYLSNKKNWRIVAITALGLMITKPKSLLEFFYKGVGSYVVANLFAANTTQITEMARIAIRVGKYLTQNARKPQETNKVTTAQAASSQLQTKLDTFQGLINRLTQLTKPSQKGTDNLDQQAHHSQSPLLATQFMAQSGAIKQQLTQRNITLLEKYNPLITTLIDPNTPQVDAALIKAFLVKNKTALLKHLPQPFHAALNSYTCAPLSAAPLEDDSDDDNDVETAPISGRSSPADSIGSEEALEGVLDGHVPTTEDNPFGESSVHISRSTLGVEPQSGRSLRSSSVSSTATDGSDDPFNGHGVGADFFE